MRKTVFITGAVINTGYAIAEKFASEGWNIVITSRREAELLDALDKLRKNYSNITIEGYVLDGVRSDNTIDENRVKTIFKDMDSRKISIDCLVLNAANLGLGQRIFESPLSEFINVINVNVVLNYLLSEEAAKRMKEKGEGSIVFINSNTAYRAVSDRIAYSASKSGQLGLMRAMALDLGKYNIRVNAILPGMIRTDRWDKFPDFYENNPARFTPLGDVAKGADIADAVWYFATSARNTTGAELTIDGGNMIQLFPSIPQE